MLARRQHHNVSASHQPEAAGLRSRPCDGRGDGVQRLGKEDVPTANLCAVAHTNNNNNNNNNNGSDNNNNNNGSDNNNNNNNGSDNNNNNNKHTKQNKKGQAKTCYAFNYSYSSMKLQEGHHIVRSRTNEPTNQSTHPQRQTNHTPKKAPLHRTAHPQQAQTSHLRVRRFDSLFPKPTAQQTASNA